MTRITAIALLQIRAAVRSKLFISLTAVLVLVLFGLPPTMKGDGTLLGYMKILLYYTLGLTTIILGAATLWTSSAAISQEIESRQIHLIAVKPVQPFEIWIGKWLGILVMNAALLCFAGLIIMGLIHQAIGDAGRKDQELRIVKEELLTGRRLIRPHDTLQKDARERYDALLKQGEIPQGAPREQVLSEIVKQLISEKTVVPPLAVKRWVLELPADLRSPEDHDMTKMVLKIRFSPVRAGNNPISGQWNIGTERKPAVISMNTDTSLNSGLDGMYRETITVTRELLTEVMAAPGRRLIVEYKNDSKERSRTLIFDRTSGIELYIRESGFESNLVRALLVVLCRLALIAALGLTASTLFSSPVAAFASFSIFFVSGLMHYFILMSQINADTHSEGETKESYWQQTTEKAVKKLEIVVGPVMNIEAVGPLSDGVLVSWKSVGKAVLLMGIFYPALLGTAGILLFRRRELALPYT